MEDDSGGAPVGEARGDGSGVRGGRCGRSRGNRRGVQSRQKLGQHSGGGGTKTPCTSSNLRKIGPRRGGGRKKTQTTTNDGHGDAMDPLNLHYCFMDSCRDLIQFLVT